MGPSVRKFGKLQLLWPPLLLIVVIFLKKIPLEVPANRNCSCSVPALVLFVPIAKNRESDSKGHLVRSKGSRRTPAILKASVIPAL